jgi:DMSO/TMAO reductase YedYZ molybdopterin-dependent catalytic subunit
MRRPSLALGTSIGLITSLPVIALFYLGNALFNLPFVPFDLFDWFTRVLPGGLITFGIDSMVSTLRALGLDVSDTAKTAEQLMALAIVVISGAVMGFVITAVYRQRQQQAVESGAAVGTVLFFVVALALFSLGLSGNPMLVLLWLLLLTTGWGAFIGWTVRRLHTEAATGEEDLDRSRRDLLLKLAGASAGVALGAWGMGSLGNRESANVVAESGAGQPLPSLPAATPLPDAPANPGANIPPTPSGRIEPAPGTRPEVTSNEEFYRIDINTRPPVLNANSWQLEISGLFQNTGTMTIDDLMAFPAVTQPLTLSCISNRVGGDLIGTSYWTGIRLRDLLEDLQLAPQAGALVIRAADGFYETVIAEDMMDERTLLVYGMNGETLPIEHGFPLRIYIPNRYGMKQPKWITSIEAVEAWVPGYWVDRGWSREARPQIVSVIDTIAVEAIDNGHISVGGIAWAGDRGIERVELRVDDGPWVETELRTPPISSLTWVQWRYDWPAESGRHTLTVRATDGTGTVQTEEEAPPHPDGATGYHSQTVSV